MSSYYATQFNREQTPSAYRTLVRESPAEAATVVRTLAKATGRADLVTEINGIFKLAESDPTRGERLRNVLKETEGPITNFIAIARAQRQARAADLGWGEIVPDAASAPVVTGMLLKGVGEQMLLDTPQGTMRLASGNNTISTRDMVSFEGETVSIRGWIDDSNPNFSVMRVDEWIPGEHADFVTGRIADQDGKIGIQAPRGFVSFTHADWAKLGDWRRVGMAIPGAVSTVVDAAGKESLVYRGGMPDSMYILTSLWQNGFPNRQSDAASGDTIYFGITPSYRADGTVNNNTPVRIVGPAIAGEDAYVRRIIEGRIEPLSSLPAPVFANGATPPRNGQDPTVAGEPGAPSHGFRMTRAGKAIDSGSFDDDSATPQPNLDALASHLTAEEPSAPLSEAEAGEPIRMSPPAAAAPAADDSMAFPEEAPPVAAPEQDGDTIPFPRTPPPAEGPLGTDVPNVGIGVEPFTVG